MRTYYVYIMASRSRALYTGVTRELRIPGQGGHDSGIISVSIPE